MCKKGGCKRYRMHGDPFLVALSIDYYIDRYLNMRSLMHIMLTNLSDDCNGDDCGLKKKGGCKKGLKRWMKGRFYMWRPFFDTLFTDSTERNASLSTIFWQMIYSICMYVCAF